MTDHSMAIKLINYDHNKYSSNPCKKIFVMSQSSIINVHKISVTFPIIKRSIECTPKSVFKCSRTPDPIHCRFPGGAVTSTAVCCVLFLAPPGVPETLHCITSLVCKRFAEDPALTRHHDQPLTHWAPLLWVRCVRKRAHTPSLGLRFNGHFKKPWKTKYKHHSYITNNYNITITIPFTIQLTQ